MFTFNNVHKPITDTQALRAIIHATENNPDGIQILIDTDTTTSANHKACGSNKAVIDVILHGDDDTTYIFKLITDFNSEKTEVSEGEDHIKYNITVQYSTKDGLGYPIDLKTIDKFGRTHKEKEVTLSTDDIQPEIERIFEILNQRAKTDKENPHSFSVFFDYAPF